MTDIDELEIDILSDDRPDYEDIMVLVEFEDGLTIDVSPYEVKRIEV